MKKYHTMDELISTQIELEIQMKTNGIARFNLNNERSINEGSNSETAWNRRIMQTLIDPMSQAIQAYLDYYKTRACKPSKTLYYLSLLTTQQAAYITIKNIIDSLTREVETREVAKTIGDRIEDQVRFAGLYDKAPKYIDKVKDGLKRRNSKKYSHLRKVLQGSEDVLIKGNAARNLPGLVELKWAPWKESDIMHIGSRLIDIFASNITFEGNAIITKHSSKTKIGGRISEKCYLVPTGSISGWIEKYREAMEIMAPAFTPCVIEPRSWISPTQGGYHVQAIADTLPLVKCRLSQLKRLTIDQMPEVYQAVNKLQSVAWQVSDKVLEIALQSLKLGIGLGLPQIEPYDIPEAPIKEEYQHLKGPELKGILTVQEWEDFRAWKTEASSLYTLEQKRQADFIKASRVLGTAKQYQEYERLHFVYTADFRGRVYCKSDSVSPQGDDLQKGLIRFAEGLPLGERGYFWLAVQGAGVYGNDKITFEERVKFIESIEDEIRDIASDPLTFTQWVEADKPWQYLNWCFEWSALLDWIEDGKQAEAFVSHIPIAMDGSCSGIQHYSAILRDPIAGGAVNLTPDTKPHDIYGDVAKVAELSFKELTAFSDTDIPRVVQKLQETENKQAVQFNREPVDISGEVKALARGWLSIQGGINRNLTKSPVMTLPYGSTQLRCLTHMCACLNGLQEKQDKLCKSQGIPVTKAHPFVEPGKEGLNKNKAEKLGSSVIWDSIGKVVIGPKIAMKYIQKVANFVAKEGSHLEWITPTGFIVEQREYDYTSKRVKTQLLGETFFSLKEEKTTYNARKMKTSSAPNFIHSMDASHLVKAVNSFDEKGINSIAVIHDSFGTHACNTDKLRQALRDSFVDMYTSNDVLADYKESNEALICKEIDVPVPDKYDLDLEKVRDSKYLFG